MLKTLTIREIRDIYEAFVTAKKLKFDEKMRYAAAKNRRAVQAIYDSSEYSRTDGGVGTTLYVTQGGDTWNAVASV